MTASNPAAPFPPIPQTYGSPATWSVDLDGDELRRRIRFCRDAAPNTTEKGNRLEELACWLLCHLEGFEVQLRDAYSASGSQEIDIVFWNGQMANGLPSLGSEALAECKNWAHPVDSSDVAWFHWKMRLGGVYEGFLFAANGITGDPKRLSRAIEIVCVANSDEPSRKIHVLTFEELEGLDSTEGLRTLIKRKRALLAVRDPFRPLLASS